MLYTLRGLKRPIDIRPLRENLAVEPSSSIALLLLDMKSKGLCIGKLPTSEWDAKITEESIQTDWTWLLAYEGFRHGWLTDHHGLMAKPLFQPMASRNVVFYDPKRNINTSASEAKARRIRRRKNLKEVREILGHLRGVDLGLY